MSLHTPARPRRLYYQPAGKTEHDEEVSENTTHPQDGELAGTTGTNHTVSASRRTLPSVRDRLKPNSIYRVGSTGRDVVWRRWTLTTHDMHDLDNDGSIASTSDGASFRAAAASVPRGVVMYLFDAFDGCCRQVSNGKSQDCSDHLTGLTDLTPIEWGCTWRASAPEHARDAPLTHLPYKCRQIRQIRQPHRAVLRFRFAPRRQTRCQIDANRSNGVVA